MIMKRVIDMSNTKVMLLLITTILLVSSSGCAIKRVYRCTEKFEKCYYNKNTGTMRCFPVNYCITDDNKE